MALSGPVRVEFEQVFPVGAYALDVAPVTEFGAKAAGRQETDKVSGLPLWAVTVIDADPNARQKQAKVKVAAKVCPTLPPEAAGLPFRPVEFDRMTVTPWVEYTNGKDPQGRDRARVSYSLRASGIRAPSSAAKPAAPKAA